MIEIIDERIKKSLSFTWTPFFSHFGKLTDIQREVIPAVLNGENLVVCSPKATGKTEAVLAPLVERWLKTQKESLSVVYISPTRALVNDVCKRVKPPFDYLNIPLSRRTGDHPEFTKERITPFLITTPESLDSLLCRCPAVFKDVKGIVIDEAHLLYNSYRGDQLRILLRRLKRIADKPELYLMSATINDPEGIGKNFIEDDYKTAFLGSPLKIEYYLIQGDKFTEEIGEEIRKKGLKKMLFFVNSRYEAEKMARILSPLSRNLWVHHGSMSKKEREEVELAINRAKSCICVATSTLEFGIDVGDIDAVILISPPSDTASLLQRLGRGNRRKESYILAYGIYYDDMQRIIFEQLFEDEKNRDYPSLSHEFDLSVIYQQIISYVTQKARVGTSVETIKGLFEGIVSPEDIGKIIITLLDKGFLLTGKSELLSSGPGIKNAILYGSIHSNIPDRGEFEVWDISTSRMIGKVENPFPCFSLCGHNWMVVSSEGNKVWVKSIQKGGGGNVFRGRNIPPWDFRFGMRLKKRFFPELEEYEIPYIQKDNYFYILHFVGSLYSFIWTYTLKEKKKIEDTRDILFVSESLDIIPEREEIFDAVRETAHLISQQLSFGRYFNLLPKELKEKQVLSSLKIDGFTEWLSRIQFCPVGEREICFLQ